MKYKPKIQKELNKDIKALKIFVRNLYKRYGIAEPHITTVPDGIYIHTGDKFMNSNKEMKLFVSIFDFRNSPELVAQYIENTDDRIIQKETVWK